MKPHSKRVCLVITKLLECGKLLECVILVCAASHMIHFLIENYFHNLVHIFKNELTNLYDYEKHDITQHMCIYSPYPL